MVSELLTPCKKKTLLTRIQCLCIIPFDFSLLESIYLQSCSKLGQKFIISVPSVRLFHVFVRHTFIITLHIPSWDRRKLHIFRFSLSAIKFHEF